MERDMTRAAVCPVCGEAYGGRPALSRHDNKTLICPDCGTRQALALIGVAKEEREEILRIIHAHMQSQGKGPRGMSETAL